MLSSFVRNSLKLFRLSIGNAIEWYDFCLYGYFATIIAKLYFPSENPTTSLLIAFSAFTVGFIARPLGGLIFGHLGDVKGRHYAMNVAITTMSLATFTIAFLPEYSSIGIAAPCLLIFLRLIQGISAGGQYGNLITIASEESAFRFKGLYAGLAFSVSAIGFMFASLASQLALNYTPASLSHYAWRLPFLISGVLLLVQLVTRVSQDEENTVIQKYQEVSIKNPLVVMISEYTKPFLIVIGLVTCGSSVYYLVYTYMVTYITSFMHVPLEKIMQINTVSLVLISILIPLFGFLSDFIDRKQLLITGFVVFIVGCYPIMQLLWHGYTATSMLLMSAILSWISGLITPAYFELFPKEVRAAGCTLGSCIGTAISGIAPLAAVGITLYGHSAIIWLYLGLLIAGLFITTCIRGTVFTDEYYAAKSGSTQINR